MKDSVRELDGRKATAKFIEFNRNKQIRYGVWQREPMKGKASPRMAQVNNGWFRHLFKWWGRIAFSSPT